METFTTSWQKLDQLKTEINQAYLDETTLDNLKTKRQEIVTTAKAVTDAWEQISPEDVPDYAAEGWETKKDEAIQIRDDILGLLDAKIKALEPSFNPNQPLSDPQKSEVPIDTQIANLKAKYDLLLDELKKINITYIRESTKEQLEQKKTSILNSHAEWKADFDLIDKTRISNDQATAMQGQRTKLANEVDDKEGDLSNGILTLRIREQTKWIKDHMESHTTKDKEVNDKIDETLRMKEAAERERDEERRKRTEVEGTISDVHKKVTTAENERDEHLRLRREAENAKETALRELRDLQRRLDELKNQPSTSGKDELDAAREAAKQAEKERDAAQEAIKQETRKRREAEGARSEAERKLNEQSKCSMDLLFFVINRQGEF